MCSLYWPVNTQLFKELDFFWRGGQIFSEIAKMYGFAPATVNNEGVSRGMSVAVGTSMAL